MPLVGLPTAILDRETLKYKYFVRLNPERSFSFFLLSDSKYQLRAMRLWLKISDVSEEIAVSIPCASD